MAKKKTRKKIRKSRVVYVSFDPAVADKLIEEATREDRPIATQVERIVRQYYESQTNTVALESVTVTR